MTTPSRRKRAALVAVLVVLAGFLPACYTLFQHPRLAHLDYARPRGEPCLSCHSAEEMRAWLMPQRARPAPGAWARYYDDPWWLARFTRPDTTSAERDADNEGQR